MQKESPELLPWGGACQLGWAPSPATLDSWDVPEEGVQELGCAFSADRPVIIS
jgi:hypothetical protein